MSPKRRRELLGFIARTDQLVTDANYWLRSAETANDGCVLKIAERCLSRCVHGPKTGWNTMPAHPLLEGDLWNAVYELGTEGDLFTIALNVVAKLVELKIAEHGANGLQLTPYGKKAFVVLESGTVACMSLKTSCRLTSNAELTLSRRFSGSSGRSCA